MTLPRAMCIAAIMGSILLEWGCASRPAGPCPNDYNTPPGVFFRTAWRGAKAAAAVELCHHGLYLLLGAVQGGNARPLAECSSAGYAVNRQLDHVGHQLFGHDSVPQTPTRHGVALGEAIQDDRALHHSGESGDAVVAARVKDVLVYLVGHHVQALVGLDHAGDGLQFLAAQHRSAGVPRRVEYEQPCTAGDLLGQVLQVGMVTLLFQEPHRHGCGPGEPNHGFIDGEAGVGVDHLDTRLGQGQNHIEHDGLGARRHHNLGWVGIHPAHLAAIAGDRLSELG